jgi:uncharacterized membrane protein YhfC
MEMDLTQTLSPMVSTMLSAGGVILLSAIIVIAVVVAKRWNGRVMPGILGIIAYAVFVFIFANLLTSAMALIPSIDNAFYNDSKTYYIVYYLLAAVGFTLARIVTGYMLKDRFERKGDVYMAGLGLSVGDSILYGITTLSYLTWCTAINSMGLAEAFADFSAEEAASTYETISVLFTAPSVLWLLLGINCVLDIAVNIALMSVVFGAVKKSLSPWWYGISLGITFFSAISFQLYDENSLLSILICFAIKLVIFAATMYYTFKVAGKEIAYLDD